MKAIEVLEQAASHGVSDGMSDPDEVSFSLDAVRDLVEAVAEFVRPWETIHYPQLREPLARVLDGQELALEGEQE